MTVITLADIQAKQNELESMIAEFKKQTNKPHLEVSDAHDAIRINIDGVCGLLLYKDNGTLYINSPAFKWVRESAGFWVFTRRVSDE
jgi:hypothetical protein